MGLVLQSHIRCLGDFDLGYRAISLRGETLPVAGRCGIQGCPMPQETNCDCSTSDCGHSGCPVVPAAHYPSGLRYVIARLAKLVPRLSGQHHVGEQLPVTCFKRTLTVPWPVSALWTVPDENLTTTTPWGSFSAIIASWKILVAATTPRLNVHTT